MTENRTSRRSKVLKKGRIIYNNGHSVVDCLVRNLSEYGAGLDVPEGFTCPPTFHLDIQGGEKRAAEVVWQANTKVGLRFMNAETEVFPKPVKAARSADAQTSPLERINAIQAELDELRREVEAMLG